MINRQLVKILTLVFFFCSIFGFVAFNGGLFSSYFKSSEDNYLSSHNGGNLNIENKLHLLLKIDSIFNNNPSLSKSARDISLYEKSRTIIPKTSDSIQNIIAKNHLIEEYVAMMNYNINISNDLLTLKVINHTKEEMNSFIKLRLLKELAGINMVMASSSKVIILKEDMVQRTKIIEKLPDSIKYHVLYREKYKLLNNFRDIDRLYIEKYQLYEIYNSLAYDSIVRYLEEDSKKIKPGKIIMPSTKSMPLKRLD